MTEMVKQTDQPKTNSDAFERIFGTTDHNLFWPVIVVLVLLLDNLPGTFTLRPKIFKNFLSFFLFFSIFLLF